MKRIQAAVLFCLALAWIDIQAGELIVNGNFTDSKTDVKPWMLQDNGYGMPASVAPEPKGGAIVHVTEPKDKTYLFLEQEVNIKAEKKYILKFETKSDAKKKNIIVALVKQEARDKTQEGIFILDRQNIKTTADWQKCEYEFTGEKLGPEEYYKDKCYVRFLLGSLDGDCYLRNISLVEQ
jgi:hypothetical protein